MLGMLAVAGLALAMVTAPATPSDSSPPSGKITLDIKTINGSGCPAGTADASAEVASDNTSFTVKYDNFTAKAGKGASAIDFRKNCQINVLVHIPQGFTYAIARVDYRGFAHLPTGSTALEQASPATNSSSTVRLASTLAAKIRLGDRTATSRWRQVPSRSSEANTSPATTEVSSGSA